MANVLFKQGTQNALNSIRTAHSATAGTFYLTSDNHKLYIGVENGDAVPVNEGVTTVGTINDLPNASYLNAGEFYYVTASNVLCIYNGTQWVQINANTNTYIESITIDVTVADGIATIKSTLLDSNGRTYSDDYKVQGANGTLVSANATNDGIVITGDAYELSEDYNDTTKIATISLTSENTDNDTSIAVKAGNNVTFLQHDDNYLEIQTADTTLASGTSGYGASSVDTSGTGFYVQATDTKGNHATAAIDPIVKIGGEATYQESVHFKDGTATLPVYTKNEIDRKFVGLDAMTYRGTIGSDGSTSALPTSGLHCGDTYLVANHGERLLISTGVYAQHGDMLIARGTEFDGEITAQTLEWDIVPSGDDSAIDTTYTIVPTSNGFMLFSSGGTDSGTFTVNGDGTYITVSDDQDAQNKSNVLTVNHRIVTATATNASTSAGDDILQANTGSLVIPAVTSIQRDAAGHVTDVKVQNYEVKDTNSTVHAVTAAAAAENGLATVTTSVTTRSSAGVDTTRSGAFGIKSESLSVTASGATVTVDMVWGTF